MHSLLRMAALAVIAALLLFSGCKKDSVAKLPELPREAATKLKSAGNARVLATNIDQSDPGPPPKDVPPVGLCAQDATTTYFDAQITTPITLCTREEETRFFQVAWFPETSPASAKLIDPSILAGLKDAVLWQPPLVCRTTDGPWSARIIKDRQCIGTCSPLNTLFVVGVPNNVIFAWYGSFEKHPPGFEFVGSPVQTDEIDYGPCNGNPGEGGGSIPLRRP